MSSSKYQEWGPYQKGLGAGVRTDKEEEEPEGAGSCWWKSHRRGWPAITALWLASPAAVTARRLHSVLLLSPLGRIQWKTLWQSTESFPIRASKNHRLLWDRVERDGRSHENWVQGKPPVGFQAERPPISFRQLFLHHQLGRASDFPSIFDNTEMSPCLLLENSGTFSYYRYWEALGLSLNGGQPMTPQHENPKPDVSRVLATWPI